ncbi:hypothetical protein GQ457_08G025280 [Hibiscus cannabinus]
MTRANPTALEYQFEPEIERVCQRNRKEFRAMSDPPNNRNNANNNQIAAAGGGNPPLAVPLVQARNRPFRDHLLPDLENLNPRIVTLEIQATQFKLKLVMFNMLNSIGQFGGLTHEDARQHLRSFIEARAWFNNIPSRFVESWDDLCRSFIIRYSSTVLTDKLRNDITSFRQIDDESMYVAWDRYKELFRKCPMHGFNEWTKVIMFYNRVNALTMMMLDVSTNGTLLDKSAEEATEILDRIANNDYQFPSTRKQMTRRNVTAYELEPTDAVSTQLAALTNMFKNLQRPSNSQEVKKYEFRVKRQCSNHWRPKLGNSPKCLAQGHKASNDAIQVEENEQLSNEENESPEIVTTIPHATSTKGILPEDVVASSHTAASSSHDDKPEKRTRLSEFETIATTEGCMTMLHNRLPPKFKDPGSFTIPCAIGNHYVGKALCDLGASINLMPKSVFERLGIGKARPTTVMLQLADRSYIQPEGKIEDILLRVDKFIFPADFIVVDCEADEFAPIILGRQFLATGRALIDVEKGQLTIRVNEQQVTLDAFTTFKRSNNPEECHNVNVIDAELETYLHDYYLTTES